MSLKRNDIKHTALNAFMIICFTQFLNSHSLSGKTFYNPTGSYELVSKKKVKNGETYGYHGEIHIKLLDSAHIAMSFYVCKGAPGYNSGSFVDTLDYENSIVVYTTDQDPSCRITFTFSKSGVAVDEIANNYNNGCGFGHAVVASGFYKKISSKEPEIRDLMAD